MVPWHGRGGGPGKAGEGERVHDIIGLLSEEEMHIYIAAGNVVSKGLPRRRLVLIKPSYPRSKGCHADWFDSIVNKAEVASIKEPKAPCFGPAGAEMSSHVVSAIGCEDVLQAHKSCKTVF